MPEGRREPGNWEQSWDVEIRLGIIRQSLETITEGRVKREEDPRNANRETWVEAEKKTHRGDGRPHHLGEGNQRREGCGSQGDRQRVLQAEPSVGLSSRLCVGSGGVLICQGMEARACKP